MPDKASGAATEKEVPGMSLTYGMIALVSLCMVGVFVAADKKRDICRYLLKKPPAYRI